MDPKKSKDEFFKDKPLTKERIAELRKLTGQRSLGFLEQNLPFVSADRKFSNYKPAELALTREELSRYKDTDSEFLTTMSNQIPPKSVIIAIRKSLGLRQQDCARICMVSLRQWQRIESGKCTPTLSSWNLFLICTGLQSPKLPEQAKLKIDSTKLKRTLGLFNRVMLEINHQ